MTDTGRVGTRGGLWGAVLFVSLLAGCGRDQRTLEADIPAHEADAPEPEGPPRYFPGNTAEPLLDVLIRSGVPSLRRPSWLVVERRLWAFDSPLYQPLASIRAVEHPEGRRPEWGEELDEEAHHFLPREPRHFWGGDVPVFGGVVGQAIHFFTETGWRQGEGYRLARVGPQPLKYGAATRDETLYLVQRWEDRLILQTAELIDLSDLEAPVTDSPPLDLGDCPRLTTDPKVVVSEVGVHVIADCFEGRLSRFLVHPSGTVDELEPLLEVNITLDDDGTAPDGCGGEDLVPDGEHLLAVVPFASGAEIHAFDRTTGSLTRLLSLPEEISRGRRVTLGATESYVFALAGGCTESEPTLCSFEKSTRELVACHPIRYTIDGNTSHLIGSLESAYFIYEDHRDGSTPAILDLSTTDPTEPPAAAVIGERIESEFPLDLRCDRDGCQLLTSEISAEQSWPRDYFTDSRPIYYDVSFDSGQVERAPGDTLFWSRTAEARFGVEDDRYFSLDGRFVRTVMNTSGARLVEFSEALDDFVPIAEGVVAWEWNRVCRFREDRSEPVECVTDAAYLQDISGENEMRLLRCDGEIHWSFSERLSDFGDPARRYRVRFAPFDVETLTPESELVDVELEFESSAVNHPVTGCTNTFFFVTEMPPSSVVHRFPLEGGADDSHDFSLDVPSGDPTLTLVLDDAIVKGHYQTDSSRLELFLLEATGTPLQRAVELPREARWLNVAALDDQSLIAIYHTRASRDLRLARLPLRLFHEVGSFADLSWPESPEPESPPEYRDINDPPCSSGTYFGDLEPETNDAVSSLTGCRTVIGDLVLSGEALTDVAPLAQLERVFGTLHVNQAPGLTSLAPLSGLRAAHGIEIFGQASGANPSLAVAGGLAEVERIGLGGLRLHHIADPSLDLEGLDSFLGPFEISVAPSLTQVVLPSDFSTNSPVQFSMYSTGMTHCDIETLAAHFGQTDVGSPSVCGNVADACGDEICEPFR